VPHSRRAAPAQGVLPVGPQTTYTATASTNPRHANQLNPRSRASSTLCAPPDEPIHPSRMPLVGLPQESWLDARAVVRPSPIHGRGLFASRHIDAGDVVMRLGGELINDASVRDLVARGERYDGISIAEDVNLCIRPADWPGRFGNHSCDPNVWLTARTDLCARRYINEGEEIVSDYATYTVASDWEMVCSCGSVQCRGVVTGDDWRRRDLQQRYAGHFASDPKVDEWPLDPSLSDGD
jgi:uncharacterized protein